MQSFLTAVSLNLLSQDFYCTSEEKKQKQIMYHFYRIRILI